MPVNSVLARAQTLSRQYHQAEIELAEAAFAEHVFFALYEQKTIMDLPFPHVEGKDSFRDAMQGSHLNVRSLTPMDRRIMHNLGWNAEHVVNRVVFKADTTEWTAELWTPILKPVCSFRMMMIRRVPINQYIAACSVHPDNPMVTTDLRERRGLFRNVLKHHSFAQAYQSDAADALKGGE